jgi:two-component system sensor histidine kinase GlrK
MADSDKFFIVFGNLLSNAIRFSPDGGTIQFTLSNEPNGVRIDCIDEGPGVAPSDVSRIFEPFYQGVHQPAGARRGSGIGLSIVREYVEAHRGTVQLLPSGKGAHFRIELTDEH